MIKKQTLQSILGTTLLIFLSTLSSAWITARNINKNTNAIIKQDLVGILSSLPESARTVEGLKQEIKALEKHPHLNVSLIAQNGKLEYDSKSYKKEFKNTLKEEEILNTKHSGIGTSIRYNFNTKTLSIFAATKIKINKKSKYLRISYPAQTLSEILLKLAPKLILQNTILILISSMVILYKRK